jgi:hypothetical protein
MNEKYEETTPLFQSLTYTFVLSVSQTGVGIFGMGPPLRINMKNS